MSFSLSFFIVCFNLVKYILYFIRSDFVIECMNTEVCVTQLLARTGGVCCTEHSKREFVLCSSPLRSWLTDFANPAVQREMCASSERASTTVYLTDSQRTMMSDVSLD